MESKKAKFPVLHRLLYRPDPLRPQKRRLCPVDTLGNGASKLTLPRVSNPAPPTGIL